MITLASTLLSVGLVTASVCLYIDADEKFNEAQHTLNNLSRLQLITALAVKDKSTIRMEETKMKKIREIKAPALFSNTSTATKVIGGLGLAATIGGIGVNEYLKGRGIDCECAGVVEAAEGTVESPKGTIAEWIDGQNKVCLVVTAVGIVLVVISIVRAIREVRAAKKLAAEAEEIPEVVDPEAQAA